MAVEENPMADTPEFDAQDMAEVWDEDNQNTEADRMAGADDGFSFETQPDLYDATKAVGDEDDDEALIGDDLDDAEIVALSENADDDDAEDDDLRARSADAFDDEDDDELDFDGEDPDLDDRVARLGKDEVELEDAGDMTSEAHAEGSAERFEVCALIGRGDRPARLWEDGGDHDAGASQKFRSGGRPHPRRARAPRQAGRIAGRGIGRELPGFGPHLGETHHLISLSIRLLPKTA